MIYLILPAFNEEKNLKKIFEQLNSLDIVRNITVILVDDCSQDETSAIFQGKKNKFFFYYLKNKKNYGLSLTLKNGFEFISDKLKINDLIVTMDSDNTHPVNIIPEMIEKMKMEKSNLIIASRYLKDSEVNGLSFLRKILSQLAKLVFSFLFPHKNLREYTCNFRIYKSFLIKEILSQEKFFKGEDFNITIKILLFLIEKFKDLKISEYPLILNYDQKIGSSKLRILKNIFLTLKLIFLKKFKLN